MKPIGIMRMRNAGAAGPSYGPELVSNGTFDTDTTGWTALGGASLSIVSGQMRAANVGAVQGGFTQEVAVELGATYAYAMTGITGESAGRTRIGTTSGGTNIVNNTVSGTFTGTFVASGTSVWISGAVGSAINGRSATFDNFSLKKVL